MEVNVSILFDMINRFQIPYKVWVKCYKSQPKFLTLLLNEYGEN